MEKNSEGAGTECTPGKARPMVHITMEKSIVLGGERVYMSRKTLMNWFVKLLKQCVMEVIEKAKKGSKTELYYIPLLRRLHAQHSLQNHMALHPAKEETSFWGSFREGKDGEMKRLESRII